MGVRIGVVGLGMMGRMYSEILATLGGAELVGCADVDEKRLSEVCAALNVPGYTDYQELLERKDVDAVAICTPDQLHLEFCMAAARSGKHMIVEKPLATKVEEAERIIEEARRHGVLLTVGHLLRFEPRYVQARDAVWSGAIGEVVYMVAFRRSLKTAAERLGGRTSVAFYLGVHDIDVMRWISKDEVVEVYAQASRKIHRALGVDDVMLSVLRFRSGISATLELSWAMQPSSGRTLRAGVLVVGTRGSVEAVVEPGLCITTESGTSMPDTIHWPMVDGVRLGALREEIRHFVECVATGRQPRVSGYDALQAVKIAAAIEESVRTGGPVKL